MASFARLNSLAVRRIISPLFNSKKLISTSKKSQDTVTVNAEDKTTTAVSENKNWVSYGFSFTDQKEDENVAHATFFLAVTCCFVFGGFFWAYMPDMQMRDWSQRQAFLEIRRREKEGLPHVDPNLISLDKITLPSDEELGDTEIII